MVGICRSFLVKVPTPLSMFDVGFSHLLKSIVRTYACYVGVGTRVVAGISYPGRPLDFLDNGNKQKVFSKL